MIKKRINVLFTIATLLVANTAFSHDFTQAHMRIDHPWSRLAPSSSNVIAGYFQLKNNSTEADYLISASSPIADRVEMHKHMMQNDMMVMKKLHKVKIAPLKTITFKPGGLHLMIFNPKYIPKQGENFPLLLNFKHAGKVTVNVAIEDKGHVHSHP